MFCLWRLWQWENLLLVSPAVREPCPRKFESHHCFQHSSRISSDSVKNLIQSLISQILKWERGRRSNIAFIKHFAKGFRKNGILNIFRQKAKRIFYGQSTSDETRRWPGRLNKKVEGHWSTFLKLQLNVFAVRYDTASGEVVRYKRLVWMFAYLITDTIVSIVDTRLRLPTETPLKEMQQECNFNFITNGWARLATCGWARRFCQDYCIPKQHLITLRFLWNSNIRA